MNGHDIYEEQMSFITSNYASGSDMHKGSMLNPRKGVFENNTNESNEHCKIPGSDCFSHGSESWRWREVVIRRRLGHSVCSKSRHVENISGLERKRFNQDSERINVGKPLLAMMRDVRRVSFVGRFWGIETRRCGYFERWYLINRHSGLSTCEHAQNASDFSLSRASRLREDCQMA